MRGERITHQDIIDRTIACYDLDISNKSVEMKLSALTTWILSRVPKEKLAEVWMRVIENFTPTTQNPFPWIDTWKKHIVSTQDVDSKASEAYELLTRESNIYRDCIISDPLILSGLEAVGGWTTFCNRTVNDEKWIRKSFIESYVLAAKEDYKTDPKYYFGIGTNGKCVMIGDNEKCEQFLEHMHKGIGHETIKLLEATHG